MGPGAVIEANGPGRHSRSAPPPRSEFMSSVTCASSLLKVAVGVPPVRRESDHIAFRVADAGDVRDRRPSFVLPDATNRVNLNRRPTSFASTS